MIRIVLFAEDLAHQAVIKPMIEKISKTLKVDMIVSIRNSRGGFGRVTFELGRYISDVRKGKEFGSDLLVVATDSNCKGYSERKRELTSVLDENEMAWVCAIPDPHIERWLLLDSAAFKRVLGKGCEPPPQKCERGLFKSRLKDAVRNTGVNPTIGGIEHAEEIVSEMNFEEVAGCDPSFGHFYRDLLGALKRIPSSSV